MTGKNDPAVFCSIDTPDLDHAKALAAAMQRAGCGIKLGLEFLNAQGPQGIKDIREAYDDLPLFLDFKYHDIPNTVASAAKAVSILEPDYINLHAAGGFEMMKAAREGLGEMSRTAGIEMPKILGVTILTSLDDEALERVGYKPGTADRVIQLAKLTQEAGLDGVVCSAHEIEAVREACGPDFVLMVPGIRPEGSAANDQKRVMTPAEALDKGATHLVIGRPITQADDPVKAAEAILQQLEKQAA